MRAVPIILATLLLMVQGAIWFGRGSLPDVLALREELATQRASNARDRARIEQVAAEVADLRDGLEIIEEKARLELGMVRPDETLVVISASNQASR